MRFAGVLVSVAILAGIVSEGHARDQMQKNLRSDIRYFLPKSTITALMRIERVQIVERFGPQSNPGYIKFRVDAQIIESFKGGRSGPIAFFVTQEQPSSPPPDGEFIVSLKRHADGSLEFLDDSVRWIRANPYMIDAARAAAHKRSRR